MSCTEELKENHAVERSEQASYVFCGSKRHLLHTMFSDKARPLYHLCDLMTIERIKTNCYVAFLNTLSKEKWQKELDTDALSHILDATKNHPYYINALCRKLWAEDAPPSTTFVRQTWQHYVKQQSPWIIADLSELTLNQRKVLRALALNTTNQPQGLHFSQSVGITPASIKKSMDALLEKDRVFQDINGIYHVLDPAVGYFIQTL